MVPKSPDNLGSVAHKNKIILTKSNPFKIPSSQHVDEIYQSSAQAVHFWLNQHGQHNN